MTLLILININDGNPIIERQAPYHCTTRPEYDQTWSELWDEAGQLITTDNKDWWLFFFVFVFCFATRNLLIVAKRNLAEATWPPCNADRLSLLSERLSRPLVHFLHSMSGCFCFIFLSLGVSHLQPPTPTSTHHPLCTTNLSAPRFQSSADSGDRKRCEFFSSFYYFFSPWAAFIFVWKSH